MKRCLILIGLSLAKEISSIVDLMWRGMWFGMGLISTLGLAYWVMKLTH